MYCKIDILFMHTHANTVLMQILIDIRRGSSHPK
ncbi:hypothetical protein GYH30_038049 [Glycine max]|nr:hypothetical protein GYH30_038049 [Glycine max]